MQDKLKQGNAKLAVIDLIRMVSPPHLQVAIGGSKFGASFLYAVGTIIAAEGSVDLETEHMAIRLRAISATRIYASKSWKSATACCARSPRSIKRGPTFDRAARKCFSRFGNAEMPASGRIKANPGALRQANKC